MMTETTYLKTEENPPLLPKNQTETQQPSFDSNSRALIFVKRVIKDNITALTVYRRRQIKNYIKKYNNIQHINIQNVSGYQFYSANFLGDDQNSKDEKKERS